MNKPPAAGTWPALFGGVGLFLSVQTFLFLTSAPIAGIDDPGWFLNSGRGVAAVALSCLVVGALIAFGRRAGVREATLVALGAVFAMTAVLFSIGAGTIFPIVLVFGTAIIGIATAAGTVVGIGLRQALRASGFGARHGSHW
jgi:hypothetical protein